MSAIFEKFTPTPDHPWTTATVQLICGEILEVPPDECEDIQHCVEEYLGGSDSDYYGLARQSELLAVGSMGQARSYLMELSYLAVHPEMRGRGYGTRMLTALEEIAAAAGATIMRTTPVEEAEDFFTARGYKKSSGGWWTKHF